VPVRRRIAAVDRLAPIEAEIAPGNEVAVEVGDLAVGICEDGVVGRIRMELHLLAKRLVVFRLRAQIRLCQLLDRLVYYSDCQPLALGLADDRPMPRAEHGE